MEISSNPFVRKALYYFSFVMVFVYMAIGLMFIFTPVFKELIPRNRTALGVILVLYGAFRMYMLARYKKSSRFFQENNEK